LTLEEFKKELEEINNKTINFKAKRTGGNPRRTGLKNTLENQRKKYGRYR